MQVRFLHIVRYDKKFFESSIASFIADRRLINTIVVYNLFKEEITVNVDNVTILSNFLEVKEIIQEGDYDVLYFHSMPYHHWRIVPYIPKNKVVIWWGWGYDLYQTQEGATPLLNIDCFKPITKRLFKRMFLIHNCIRSIVYYFKKPFNDRLIRNCLYRIDYFQPVISSELELMKEHYPSFRADEFYSLEPIADYIREYKGVDSCGDILLGNSASMSNNHLDVWSKISKYISNDQQCIVPLSYGDMTYAHYISKEMSGINLKLIFGFMPLDEYRALTKGCKYMVMGVIRQQAMGNISYGIRNGLKIFLYKDSIVYHYLRGLGLKVFPIEEIDENSFRKGLSLEEQNYNIACYNNEFHRRNNVYNEVISKLYNK